MKENWAMGIFAFVFGICATMTLVAIFAIPFALEDWVMVDIARGHAGRLILCIIFSLAVAFLPMGILFSARWYLSRIVEVKE